MVPRRLPIDKAALSIDRKPGRRENEPVTILLSSAEVDPTSTGIAVGALFAILSPFTRGPLR